MIQAVSAKQNAVDTAKSMDAVVGILENARAQSTRLNEKLLKAGVQEKVRDMALGSRIDINA